MPVIKTVLVDDEEHCTDRLVKLLITQAGDWVHIVATASTVEEGIAAIKKHQPQLIFLDIEIHDKKGFDLLQEFPDPGFNVIFCTAHDKYAVQAFKCSAIDYLLKPVNAGELKEALEKLAAKNYEYETGPRLETLYHNLKTIESATKKICISTASGMEVISVSNIIRCESQANYTNIHFVNKSKILVAKTIKEFADMLTPYNFFRVHNSDLINMVHVKKFTNTDAGLVLMEDGTLIQVAVRRKEDFIKALREL